MNRAKPKELALDLAHDLVGSFLYAASIQVFILNARIATCGISGLAISINHIFPVLPIGALTLALNVPLMFLSYHLLGRKFFCKKHQVDGPRVTDNRSCRPHAAAVYGR